MEARPLTIMVRKQLEDGTVLGGNIMISDEMLDDGLHIEDYIADKVIDLVFEIHNKSKEPR